MLEMICSESQIRTDADLEIHLFQNPNHNRSSINNRSGKIQIRVHPDLDDNEVQHPDPL